MRDTMQGPAAVGRVGCRDGWAAARLLLASAIEDSQTAVARDIALGLRRESRTDLEFAANVHEYVKRTVRFFREPGETFTNTGYTLGMGGGDCDDHARAVYALAAAGGLGVAMAFLHHGDAAAADRRGPTHAVAQLCAGGACHWAETTVDARLGEHPFAAADRLGLLGARGDLAKEVRIMTERDLRPVPAGFDGRTSPAQLALDVQALGALGLCTGNPTHAGDAAFRGAVRTFQIGHPPLWDDGLIGPQTRAAIVRALPPGELADGYRAATIAGIGDTWWDPSGPQPTGGQRTTDLHHHALATLREALRLDAPDLANLDADRLARILGIAWGESRYGSTKDWGDSNNWGAVSCAPRMFPAAWGCLQHDDHAQDGTPVRFGFQKYPTQLDAARGFVRVLLRGAARQAVATGSSRDLAASMYANHYYTGFPPKGRAAADWTADDRIGAYQSLIDGGARTVLHELGLPASGISPWPPASRLGGVLAFAFVAGLIGLAAGWPS